MSFFLEKIFAKNAAKTVARKKRICYNHQVIAARTADVPRDTNRIRPCGQAVKTAPSHGAIPGSIPGKVTKQVKGEPVSFRRRLRLYCIFQNIKLRRALRLKRPPLAIRQVNPILLLVIQSRPLCLPCLKFAPVVLILIKRADRREQKPCKRVKLAALYLLISRHSPLLCSSLDRFPPFSVYSVVICRRGQNRAI